jgi:hypothetical protein
MCRRRDTGGAFVRPAIVMASSSLWTRSSTASAGIGREEIDRMVGILDESLTLAEREFGFV